MYAEMYVCRIDLTALISLGQLESLVYTYRAMQDTLRRSTDRKKWTDRRRRRFFFFFFFFFFLLKVG
jgi:hypothetical protein